MRLPPAEPDNEWLNLTPLLDVVMNLLIFFLIATHFARQEKDINVLLPEENVPAPVTSNEGKLWVNVTQDGRYRVNEKDYSEEQLGALIRGHAATNPHHPVVIRGDLRSQLRHSTRVMAICNRAKISYRLATFEQN